MVAGVQQQEQKEQRQQEEVIFSSSRRRLEEVEEGVMVDKEMDGPVTEGDDDDDNKTIFQPSPNPNLIALTLI